MITPSKHSKHPSPGILALDMDLTAFYADYTAALDGHKLGSALLDEPLDGGSVRSNLEQQKYSENVHTLYQDLKAAATRALGHEEISSPRYNALNQIFQFSVDLLMREAARLGKLTPSGREETGDHFMHTISAAFNKIFADIDELYGESLFALTNSGPVFTSVTGRSSIDSRDLEVHGTVHSTKLLPHIASTPEITLGFASPMNARIPHPASQPTEILGTFSAPNETPLTHPRWIEQPLFTDSFAPTRDGNGAFVPTEYASAVWEEKSQSQTKDEPQEMDDDDEGRPKRSGPSRHLSPAPGDEIDIGALLRWAPGNFIDNDEIKAAANGTEKELVSQLLLELQYMQRERLAAPGPELEMADDEWRVALKAQNVLARLLENATPQVKLSTKMPVLLHNYAGTMPNVDPKPVQQLMNRLPNSKGVLSPQLRKR